MEVEECPDAENCLHMWHTNKQCLIRTSHPRGEEVTICWKPQEKCAYRANVPTLMGADDEDQFKLFQQFCYEWAHTSSTWEDFLHDQVLKLRK